jgi:hypothetical protein
MTLSLFVAARPAAEAAVGELQVGAPRSTSPPRESSGRVDGAVDRFEDSRCLVNPASFSSRNFHEVAAVHQCIDRGVSGRTSDI